MCLYIYICLTLGENWTTSYPSCVQWKRYFIGCSLHIVLRLELNISRISAFSLILYRITANEMSYLIWDENAWELIHAVQVKWAVKLTLRINYNLLCIYITSSNCRAYIKLSWKQKQQFGMGESAMYLLVSQIYSFMQMQQHSPVMYILRHIAVGSTAE